MQVTYELRQRDFFDAFIAHRNRNAFAKWMFRGIVTIVFVLAGAGLFALVFRHDRESASNVAPIVGLAFMWAALMWVSPWWMAKNQFTKQPAAKGPQTLLLDDAGLHWRWDTGSAEMQWSNIIKCSESKTMFMLYSSPAFFHLVPKRALSPEQLSEFRTTLGQHIAGGGS